MLHITHTRAEGTLIDGTARGDGTAQILKAHRWRWSHQLGQWYVPQSRDKQVRHEQVLSTVSALEGAGFQVQVDVDDSPRPVAEVEAALTARQGARVERLADRSQHLQLRAHDAHAAMQAADGRVPPGGEPVKIGHHSERRHRRSLERAHQTLGASVEADRRAERAAAAVRSAAAAPGARYSAVTVANRIDKLEAEHRALVRRRDGWTRTVDVRNHVFQSTPPATGKDRALLEVAITETLEQIAYWREIRELQQAAGSATAFNAETVRPGDRVQISGTWRRVVRSNAKSVTVETGHSWTDRTPWHNVQAHEPVPARDTSK